MAKRPIQYHWFSLCRPCWNCDAEELRQCLASVLDRRGIMSKNVVVSFRVLLYHWWHSSMFVTISSSSAIRVPCFRQRVVAVWRQVPVVNFQGYELKYALVRRWLLCSSVQILSCLFEMRHPCASQMADQLDTDNGVKASQSPLRGLRAEKVLYTDKAEFAITSFSLSS